MIGLPPSPFLSAASFPAAVEPAAAHAHAPREAAAAINSNSDAVVMLASGSVTAVEAAPNAAVAAPISRITHNPVTQAVEVRPIQSSCGGEKSPSQALSRFPEAVADKELSAAGTETTAGVVPSPQDSIDCIGEIFHFARKLLEEEDDIRRAEDFINWDELEAALADPLPLFIRDDGYLKRRA